MSNKQSKTLKLAEIKTAIETKKLANRAKQQIKKLKSNNTIRKAWSAHSDALCYDVETNKE